MIRRVVSLLLLAATFTAATAVSAQEAALAVLAPESRLASVAQPTPDPLPSAPISQPPTPQQTPPPHPPPTPYHHVSQKRKLIVLGAIAVTAIVLTAIYASQRD